MPDRANILHQSQANPFTAKFGKVPSILQVEKMLLVK